MLFRSLCGILKEFKVADYLSDKEYNNAVIKHIFSADIPSTPQNISNLII
jgi:hypothetical protein